MVSLDYAKKHINLIEFVINRYNYKIIPEKTTRNYAVLKKEDKNKKDIVVIKKNDNGDWIYFNADIQRKRQGDAGTIIDFIQNREKAHLGQVRKIIYQFIQDKKSGKINIKQIEKSINITGTGKTLNLNQLLKIYATLKPALDNPYLLNERKIDRNILRNIEVFEDEKGNAVFPLLNDYELIGFAKYNKGFKNITGRKGIWLSIDRTKIINDKKDIVITESPIDYLSYIELKNTNNSIGISTLGQIGENTIKYIKSYLKDLNVNKIIIATDNDEAGEKFYKILLEELGSDYEILRDRPTNKDWNEDLVKKKDIVKINIQRDKNKAIGKIPLHRD